MNLHRGLTNRQNKAETMERSLPTTKGFRAKRTERDAGLKHQLSQQLEQDITRLLQEGIESDLTITFGPETFRLHKCMIEARCPELYKALLPLADRAAHRVPRSLLDDFRMIIKSIYSETDTTAGVDILIQMLIGSLTSSAATSTQPVDSHTQPATDSVLFSLTYRQTPVLNVELKSPVHLNNDQTSHNSISDTATNNGVSSVQQDNINDEQLKNETSVGDKDHSLENNCKQELTNASSNTERGEHTEGDPSGSQEDDGSNSTERKQFTEAFSVLGADLLYMYQAGLSVDVALVVQGQPFYAHRCILMARSNYFTAMLGGGWTESVSGEVVLQGISAELLERVLFFLYGGRLEEWDMELLAVADMFGLPGIVTCMTSALIRDKCHYFHKPCERCLVGVCECLQVSRAFGLKALQTECLQWAERHLDKLLLCKAFALLSADIQGDLLEHVRKHQLKSGTVQRTAELLHFAVSMDNIRSQMRLMPWGASIVTFTSALIESVTHKMAAYMCELKAASQVLGSEEELSMMDVVGMCIHFSAVDFESELVASLVAQSAAHVALDRVCHVLSDVTSVLASATRHRADFIRDNSDENHVVDGSLQRFDNLIKFLSMMEASVTSRVMKNINRVVGTESWSAMPARLRQSIQSDAGYITVEDKKTTAVPSFLTNEDEAVMAQRKEEIRRKLEQRTLQRKPSSQGKGKAVPSKSKTKGAIATSTRRRANDTSSTGPNTSTGANKGGVKTSTRKLSTERSSGTSASTRSRASASKTGTEMSTSRSSAHAISTESRPGTSKGTETGTKPRRSTATKAASSPRDAHRDTSNTPVSTRNKKDTPKLTTDKPVGHRGAEASVKSPRDDRRSTKDTLPNKEKGARERKDSGYSRQRQREKLDRKTSPEDRHTGPSSSMGTKPEVDAASPTEPIKGAHSSRRANLQNTDRHAKSSTRVISPRGVAPSAGATTNTMKHNEPGIDWYCKEDGFVAWQSGICLGGIRGEDEFETESLVFRAHFMREFSVDFVVPQ